MVDRCLPAQTPRLGIRVGFFPLPCMGRMGQRPAGLKKCLPIAPRPAGFLAARRGNPQSVKAEPLQPMSGGQNHKGIERVNIFLGAGCRDGQRGSGWGFLVPSPSRRSFVPAGGTLLRGDFPALVSTKLGVSGKYPRLTVVLPSQPGWGGFAGWSSKKKATKHPTSPLPPRVPGMGSEDRGGCCSPSGLCPAPSHARRGPCKARSGAQPGWTSTRQQVLWVPVFPSRTRGPGNLG